MKCFVSRRKINVTESNSVVRKNVRDRHSVAKTMVEMALARVQMVAAKSVDLLKMTQ